MKKSAAFLAAFGLFSANSLHAADLMAEVKNDLAKYAGPQNIWHGPTTSPKPVPGKKLAYVACSESSDYCHGLGVAMSQAAKELGWQLTVIDGKGTPVGWISAFNQAIALKVDGIITTADGQSIKEPLAEAGRRNIPVVGIHTAPMPGPNKELGLFTSIQQDPNEIGKAQADWIIADSNGKANVVIATHDEYAIAELKMRALQKRLKDCEGCKVLDYVNSPHSEAPQRQPQMVMSWVQKYGTPLYVVAAADYTLDFQVPPLRASGIDSGSVKLIGSDGQISAYERIRAGQFQVVTVAEPVEMEGYLAIDEMNRALNKAEPSMFVVPPYLVTKENIDREGGEKNTFNPSNDYRGQFLKMWGVTP